jgi:hypothetical protein
LLQLLLVFCHFLRERELPLLVVDALLPTSVCVCVVQEWQAHHIGYMEYKRQTHTHTYLTGADVECPLLIVTSSMPSSMSTTTTACPSCAPSA